MPGGWDGGAPACSQTSQSRHGWRARPETSFEAIEDIAATETSHSTGVPEKEAELADDLDIEVDLRQRIISR